VLLRPARCIETFSRARLARDHERVTGVRMGSEEIAARAAEGDEQAEATLRRYEGRMARALAGIINVLDPDVIVLGGGLSKLDRLYVSVPAQWARGCSRTVSTRRSSRRATGTRAASGGQPGSGRCKIPSDMLAQTRTRRQSSPPADPVDAATRNHLLPGLL